MNFLYTVLLFLFLAPQLAVAAPSWMGENGYPDFGANRKHTVLPYSLDGIKDGPFKVLVVPVAFSDLGFVDAPAPGASGTIGNTSELDYWQDIFLGTDDAGQGDYPYLSMRQYFLDASLGKMELTGSVHDVITLSETAAWYAHTILGPPDTLGGCFGVANKLKVDYNSDGGVTAMYSEVLDILDDEGIDFDALTNNDESRLDGIIVVHAGTGAEQTARIFPDCTGNDDIWSHVLDRRIAVKGTMIDTRILIVAERFFHPGEEISYPSGLGVLAHEFGHVLGFEDLYDGQNGFGVGMYSLMSLGLYDSAADDDERFGPDVHPKSIDPYHRTRMGWQSTKPVTANECFVNLSPANETDTVYAISYPQEEDYFLAEYRPARGWDADLPGSGMLIWHIDDGVYQQHSPCIPGSADDCADNHYKVAVVQMDGRYELESGLNQGNRGDPGDLLYPGMTFNGGTIPPLKSYGGTDGNQEITLVRETASYLEANIIADRSTLPGAPIIGGLPPIHVKVGDPYFFEPPIADSSFLRFSLIRGPNGMEIDPKTGRLEWTPEKQGSWTVEVLAENCSGSDTRVWSVLVTLTDLSAEGCSCSVTDGKPRWWGLAAWILLSLAVLLYRRKLLV